jgi:hypothetical protein
MKGIQQLIMEPWYIQPEGITGCQQPGVLHWSHLIPAALDAQPPGIFLRLDDRQQSGTKWPDN